MATAAALHPNVTPWAFPSKNAPNFPENVVTLFGDVVIAAGTLGRSAYGTQVANLLIEGDALSGRVAGKRELVIARTPDELSNDE